MATEKGRGYLYPNSKATPENKQPHLTGELVSPVEKGEIIKLAAWTNKSKRGDEYLSVQGKETDPKFDKKEDSTPF